LPGLCDVQPVQGYASQVPGQVQRQGAGIDSPLAQPGRATYRETQPSHSRHSQLLRSALVHQPLVLWKTGFLDSAALALHQIQAFQLPSQPPDARQAVCATRAIEPGELLPAMRTAHAKPCQRTAERNPTRGRSPTPFSTLAQG